MNIRKITVIAIFSAIYAIVSLLPGFQVIGMPGVDIRISRTLDIIYGIILGPLFGSLASFIGAIIGRIITGGGIGLLFTPLTIVSSFISGITYVKEKGWIISSIIFSIIITSWYIGPGKEIPFYAIPHIIGLLILIILGYRIRSLINSKNNKNTLLGLILISYSSTMAGQMVGNMIFLVLINPPPIFFMTTLPLTIFERITITLISALIGLPLIRVINKLIKL
ncbi:MAG: hypothetical protein DSO09_03610 [Candidatus Methanomethylicota archaeon]|jgi:hypothetical protein|uniref:ECF transporter S component n=1 Tax=Thermoproteota archaeon TaxID=2056631 RepID=A0A523BCV2_9CREN|nr:MAG: hypothetical protein EF809_05625 [Candidatus Verstraetearchaeota archaeon]TDA38781.1 MAG: hypothetical protein DSO09_03610 [Candidatus Verstraetearchaeota archaeon]